MIVQPEPTIESQLPPLRVKAVGLAPPSVTPPRASDPPPVFVMVKLSALEVVFSVTSPKARVPGVMTNTGAATPVPVSATVCGEPVASSVKLTAAE